MTGEMDLLSIDIDGNDYWVWDVISVISPRVVVIEFNASLGPEKSLTVPYDPNFVCPEKHPSGWYHGAPLTALTRLGNKKGYTLTGTNGVNAFFVKNELANSNKLPNLTPEQAFFPLGNRLKKASLDKQFDTISHLPFVEIK